SYYFYASWNPSLLFLILFSTFVDYFVGLLIYESQKEKKAGTGYLFISLFLNLGLLVFFKYLGFFSEVLHGLRINGKEIPALEVLSMPFTVNGILYSIKVSEILLPVGISFYTFQTLSYSIDVWKGKIQPESNFLKFSLYVTFFPQLVAGPIVRASDFLPSLKNRGEHFRLNPYYFSLALFFIITGLLKKTGADWLGANLSDRFFDNPSLQGNFYGLLSIYAYGLQIYGDFSGYTDMAIGSAMLLGFRLSLNFDRPYIAYSITDFWRRWHISLGKWFMHYLYIPLGGNRNMVYRNLFITMFICGLWHGAGYTFILWGLYHGFLLALERFLGFNKKSDNPVFSMIQYFITFHLVLLGWLLFISKSLELFKDAFQALHSNLSLKLPSVDILGVLFFSYIIVFLPIKLHKKIKEFWLILPPSAQAFLFVISLLVVYNLNTAEIQPFIYFQF
ncbi:MAG: MBOAT family protein, partial [Leptospiraceae bacterium]|nr:MBOAT family protein [Leptospiraceae bacterium]